MPTFFNPAANLTANRIPYALGGGRLADSASLAFDVGQKKLTLGDINIDNSLSSGRVRIVSPNNTFATLDLVATGAAVWFQLDANAGQAKSILFRSAGSRRWGIESSASAETGGNAGSNFKLTAFNDADAAIDSPITLGRSATAPFEFSRRLLSAAASDQANGSVQVPTHTTAPGGYGLFDFSLYRSGANRLACNAANIDFAGNLTVAGVHTVTQLIASGGGNVETTAGAFKQAGNVVVGSRRLGWGVPTGSESRATFDPGTVTLAQLADRVAALIKDLHATSSGHGLIGA